MLAITVHQKCGARDADTKLLTRDKTKWSLDGPQLFLTKMDLDDALAHLHAYVMAYRQRYPSMTLLMQVTHVSQIPDCELYEPDMSELDVEFIEQLKTTPEEIGL